jgi:serine/threonine protein kinase
MEITIGHYKIVEKIGEGGMAIVYKVLDTHLQRMVALKVIRPMENLDARFLKRFEREAKALAHLSHPNIVHILDYGEYESRPYLVMDYLEGGSLIGRLGSPMPISEAVEMVLPIARALEYAHKKGIVHRDIKPANIILTASGDPILTDFGIVKLMEKEESVKLTRAGAGIGTPEYMAPEQCIGGEVDQRADIYSLGVVLYELVTGRKPFTANTPMEVVIKQTVETPPKPRDILPEITAEVEKVILKALEKKPGDRYVDMASFAEALTRLQNVMPGGEQKIIQEVLPHRAFHPVVPDEPQGNLSSISAASDSLPEKKIPGVGKIFQSQDENLDIGGEENRPKRSNRRILWMAVIAGCVIVFLCLGMACIGLGLMLIGNNP